jgi:hypothetical protein|tara:strand:+ start:871 stop:1239 length:369 start_codon:yes stop_codon:yes gene_type:complete
MAVMQSRDTRTYVAGEDLSTAQFKFVTLESDGQIDLADSAGENCVGVLLNDPTSGNAATVVMSGKTLVKAGGTIAAGASVATSAAGLAVTAASGNIVMGYATEAAVSGQTMAVELIQGGNAV